jgi:hypothetical protein
LPSIGLGSDSSVQEGASIYVFGFPATADINGFNGEPSITSGAVNAFKDSTQHTFKYIQTDAKVSVGSSGGPMIDSSGTAIGVLTLLTASDSGDSFAFAIPINLAKPILAANAVSASSGDYASHFLSGLALQDSKHCKAATIEFNTAAAANPVFGSVVAYVQPHIDACAALMASGQSIDSTWDEIVNWVEQRGLTFWLGLLAGVLFVGALIVVIVHLMRRMHRGEVAMQDMSDKHDAAHPAEAPPSLPASTVAQEPTVVPVVASREALPIQVTPKNPQMAAYIEEARRSGQTNSQIRASLLGAGWDEYTVDENLGSNDVSPGAKTDSTLVHTGLQNA